MTRQQPIGIWTLQPPLAYVECVISERYAVVQSDLDQPLPRDVLQRAIVGVPGLVRADSARIAQDLYGFVIENVAAETADTFARQLTAAGADCRSVPQRLIPKLMTAMTVQRMFVTDDGFESRSVTDCVFRYRPESILLIAAGFVEREARPPKREFITSEVNWGGFASGALLGVPTPVMREHTVTESESRPKHLVLRIEVIAIREPFRINGEAGPSSVLFLDGTRINPRRPEEFAPKLARLHRLGNVRINRGLTRLLDPEFVYHSDRAFDEECRWHLLQAIAGQTGRPL